MKTSKDPRHLKRIQIMQELYAWEARRRGGLQLSEVKSKTAEEIIQNVVKIDGEIEKAAPEWPISHVNQIDLAILRLAIFELIMDKGVPFKVVTDEAVELAKEFGTDSSPAFINGALGNIIAKYELSSS